MNQLTVNKLKEETKTLDLFTGGRRSYILLCPKFFFGCFPSNEKSERETKTNEDGILFLWGRRDVSINNNAD